MTHALLVCVSVSAPPVIVTLDKEYVGILSYTTQNELVDTGSMTGIPPISHINVIGISNDINTGNIDLTHASICRYV